MASFDGSVKSLLQGVSQQVPTERLDGQVSAQVNMLSDVVDGMRRRPGMRLLQSGVMAGLSRRDVVFASTVDIDDGYVHVLVDTSTGTLYLYTSEWSLISSAQWPYLVAATSSSIQTATLRGYLYLCNTEQKPAKIVNNAGRKDPNTTGFFYIKAAQYSKIFTVTATIGGAEYVASYTVPNGQTAGDADKAVPEFIATQLQNNLNALGIPATVSRTAGYLYFQTSGAPISITSDSGNTYVGFSAASKVTTTSELPARLPAAADGTLCSVGTNPKTAPWYQYSYSTNTWLESGAYDSATSLAGMPMRVKLDGTYLVEQPTYEGRLAGNDDSNEDPPFLTDGVTGFAAFQGRLVLLSGPAVSMSASGKPLRWYRSTVTELLIVDPISIYSGAASSTRYTHAVQFNKDLLLFSRSVQAVVPSGNAIIAPSTAQIVITSSYACTDKAQPVVAGRSLLYFAPRSEEYASVLELVPSNTTDSQYTTNDITAHIPQYIPGQIRQAAASTTSNSVVFLNDQEARVLYVQQYLWQADQKVQSAWHKWTAPYDIACVWFVRDTVYIGMLVQGSLLVATLEPQANRAIGQYTRPFSDLYSAAGVQVVGRTFTLPVHLRDAKAAGAELLVTYANGSLAGEIAGVDSITGDTVRLVRNTPDGVYMVGLRYLSQFSPTPPFMRDQSGAPIGTSTVLLSRYELNLRNTGLFQAEVSGAQGVVTSGDFTGLTYSSMDLDLNYPMVAKHSRVLIPVRVPTQESEAMFSTSSEHDLGIVRIEFVLQYHQRRRRV